MILMPAFNEAQKIGEVIKTLPKTLVGVSQIDVIVVNDGSTDNTAKIALESGAIVLTHPLNRGLGGALGTGFEYARLHNFDMLITFDADGQHHPNDIQNVIKPLLDKKADVVIGSRLINPKGMPWYRIIGNFGLNLITFIFYWIWTTDSQSGLRAFSKKAFHEIQISAERMEVSSEFFHEINRLQLKMLEVPITPIYSDYSLAKGQKNSNVFKIIFKVALKRLFPK